MLGYCDVAISSLGVVRHVGFTRSVFDHSAAFTLSFFAKVPIQYIYIDLLPRYSSNTKFHTGGYCWFISTCTFPWIHSANFNKIGPCESLQRTASARSPVYRTVKKFEENVGQLSWANYRRSTGLF